MKVSDNLHKMEQGCTQGYYDDSSFNLVSNLLTKALGGNCQQILVTAKAGSFLHDPASEVASTESTQFSICNSDVNERKGVTEVFINGTLRRTNRSGCNFTIFFVLNREVLVTPGSFLAMEGVTPSDKRISAITINGMLYNSIFSLNLKYINKKGHNYPFGEGRGYLIFEQSEKSKEL